MKKIIFIMMFLIGLVINAEMIDGSYYVEKNYDKNWKSFVKILVKGNKIIGVQYDKKNESSYLSMNQKENEKYKENYGENFRDVSFKLTKSLIASQDVNNLSKINDKKSLEEFKEMVNYLIQKANEGKSGDYKM